MLDASNYTITKALTYQMFYEHLKEAANSKGTLGHRVCHAALAVIELVPIVGQIAALIELAVVKIFCNPPKSCCKNLSENKIDKLEEKTATNVKKTDNIPAIPGKYVLAGLAVLVIAPLAIYAIASRFVPPEELGDPEDLKNLADKGKEVLETLTETISVNLPSAETVQETLAGFESLAHNVSAA